MAATPFSLEGLLLYMTETFTAGVIQSYQGQGMLENAPLIQRQDPLEDFKKFDQNDEIFQEYDPPLGDDSKMGWKKSRPPKNKCRTWPFIDFNISSLFILIYFLLYLSTFSIFKFSCHHFAAMARMLSLFSNCRYKFPVFFSISAIKFLQFTIPC